MCRIPDRNWLSRSGCTTVPTGPGRATAWRSASTAGREVIRPSIEYPTIRFVQAPVTAQR
jgi:hypothetical protein